MKLRCRVAAAVVLLAAVATSGAAAGIALDQGSRIEIVKSGPAAHELELPAIVLRRYLRMVLGKRDLESGRNLVTFVLEARAKLWHELSAKDIADMRDIDAFEIEVTLAPRPTIRIRGETVLGVGYGVMHFLEEYLGITWLFPGELGLAIPGTRTIVLKAGRRERKPAIISRTFTGMLYARLDYKIPFQRDFQKTMTSERHFFTAWDYFKSLKLHLLTHASHNICHIYPSQEYGETLPEIYPLKDGKRFIPPPTTHAQLGKRQAWHPCYTNDKLFRIAVDKGRYGFEVGKQHCFSLGINDGRRIRCECAPCKHAGWPDAYFNYVARVANALKEHYPPHLVGVLVYGDVRYPRKDLRLPENVLALVAGRGLERWSKHAKHLGAYAYAYGAGFWVPNLPLKNMAFNAQAFARFGVKTYHAEVHPVWAFDAPKVYILSKLLWDPRLDVHAALRQYCDAAFGKGGGAMERFYLRWARLRDNDPTYDGAKMMCPMRIWRNAGSQFDEVTPEDYAFCAARIAEAQKLVADKRQRGRLDMVDVFFEYSRVLFTVHRLRNRVFTHHDPDSDARNLKQLLAAQTRREALVKRLEDHPEWFLGSGATLHAFLTGDERVKGGWPLRNELNSAIKTTLFLLAEAGKGKQTKTAMRDDPLALYCTPLKQEQPHVRLRKEHPWYEGRSEPMNVKLAKSVFTFRSKRGDIRFTEGTRAGTRKPHHAMATIWAEPARSRKVLLCDVRLRGRSGRLKVRTVSFMGSAGWSPIEMVHVFGPDGGTARKRFVFEPIFPLSDLMKIRTVHDVHFLWEPAADDAEVQGSLDVRQITYPFKIHIDMDRLDVDAVEKENDNDDLLEE